VRTLARTRQALRLEISDEERQRLLKVVEQWERILKRIKNRATYEQPPPKANRADQELIH
jgi:hypothetical protein